ncbi:MAG: SNF2-related protein, partial [Pirellulaceae bacterium]
LLGSWERFRKGFAEPIERDRNPDRLMALSRVIRPFILRRTKKEVLKDLPPRQEVVLFAELSEDERRKYDEARMAALSELTVNTGSQENDQQKRIRVLAWLTRLRQIACHPRLVDAAWDQSSAKLDLLMEIIEELREGEHRARGLARDDDLRLVVLEIDRLVRDLAGVREVGDDAVEQALDALVLVGGAEEHR